MEEIAWHREEPTRQGWYDCLLNGEDIRLQWWVCPFNHKKRHWKDAQGAYREVDGPVWWTGEPSASCW